MVELKTKENSASVVKFINSVDDENKKKDSKKLLDIFKKITKNNPKMWGASIIGFGKIHFKYKSGREGDWMATGFSPRKQSISLYILAGFKGKDNLLKKLGKHKTGRGCLYINKLEDVDMSILKKLIKDSYEHTIKTQTVC